MGGPLSDRKALKKNTFVPTELSVRTALGSLYLYTPQGALPRKVALKPPAARRNQAVKLIQLETKGELMHSCSSPLSSCTDHTTLQLYFHCIPLDYQCLTAVIKCYITLMLCFSFCAVATTHFQFQSNFQLSFNLISFHLHPMAPAGLTCRVRHQHNHVKEIQFPLSPAVLKMD